MTQVFISYSRRDLAFVEQLASDLKAAGLDVWYDLSGLEGGARWRIEIEKAIRASQHVVVVLSPDSVASVWVEEEYLFASKLRKNILPLFYRQCDLPLGYYTRHFIDIQGENYKRNFDEVLRSLGVDLGDRKAEQVAAKKAAREMAERESAEKAARGKAKKEAIEKAALERTQRERSERQAARRAELASKFSQFTESLKPAVARSAPVFRIMGIFGVIAILFWAGSLVMPKFIEINPIEKSSLTPTPTPTKLIIDTPISSTVTNTPRPTFTITASRTPTIAAALDNCSNDSDFISDITIPDGTAMAASEKFEKIWRIKNTGTCPWREGYSLEHVTGNSLEGIAWAIDERSEFVETGDVVDIRIEMIAPSTSGENGGCWRMRDDVGNYFGVYACVIIEVSN